MIALESSYIRLAISRYSVSITFSGGCIHVCPLSRTAFFLRDGIVTETGPKVAHML